MIIDTDRYDIVMIDHQHEAEDFGVVTVFIIPKKELEQIRHSGQRNVVLCGLIKNAQDLISIGIKKRIAYRHIYESKKAIRKMRKFPMKCIKAFVIKNDMCIGGS